MFQYFGTEKKEATGLFAGQTWKAMVVAHHLCARKIKAICRASLSHVAKITHPPFSPSRIRSLGAATLPCPVEDDRAATA